MCDSNHDTKNTETFIGTVKVTVPAPLFFVRTKHSGNQSILHGLEDDFQCVSKYQKHCRPRQFSSKTYSRLVPLFYFLRKDPDRNMWEATDNNGLGDTAS